MGRFPILDFAVLLYIKSIGAIENIGELDFQFPLIRLIHHHAAHDQSEKPDGKIRDLCGLRANDTNVLHGNATK